MRTTITIDDELLARVKEQAAAERRTLSDLVDDSLRHLIARRSVDRRERVELPTDGDPKGRLLVDLGDREALAEALGDNTWPRADS